MEHLCLSRCILFPASPCDHQPGRPSNPLLWGLYGSLIVRACVLSHFSSARLFATLWTKAHQAHLSMVLSRQEYWSGLPCPAPGELPNPGVSCGPCIAGRFFTTEPLGKPKASLHRHSWLNHWPLVIELNLQSLPLPQRSGVGLKVLTL